MLLLIERGLVLVSGKDDFVTQRQKPSLALVKTTILENKNCLQIEAPGMDKLQIPLEMQKGNKTKTVR
mgnify:CR=1 FL=1